jgi:hypothetical protein
MAETVHVAHLTPTLSLIHRVNDPPAESVETMSLAQARLLGYDWCPDCRSGRHV